MKKQISFYWLETGLFTGNTYQGPEDGYAMLDGHAAIEGFHDHKTKRVDLVTGQVVDHTPAVNIEADAASVRRDRDRRLAATDWAAMRQMEGLQMSAAMTAYRQALRDVPTQPGFPNDIAWPLSP